MRKKCLQNACVRAHAAMLRVSEDFKQKGWTELHRYVNERTDFIGKCIRKNKKIRADSCLVELIPEDPGVIPDFDSVAANMNQMSSLSSRFD